jgi:hypothetical protein
MSDLAPCNAAIYSKGKAVLTFALGADSTESWVRALAKLSKQRVDWHYLAGYAVVKVLGDERKVRNAIHDSLHKLRALGAENIQELR